MNFPEIEKIRNGISAFNSHISKIDKSTLTKEKMLEMNFERQNVIPVMYRGYPESLKAIIGNIEMKRFDLNTMISKNYYEDDENKELFFKTATSFFSQRMSFNNNLDNFKINKNFTQGLLSPLNNWIQYLKDNNFKLDHFSDDIKNLHMEANIIGDFFEKTESLLNRLSGYYRNSQDLPRNYRTVKKVLKAFISDFDDSITFDSLFFEVNNYIERFEKYYSNINNCIDKLMNDINDKDPDFLLTMADNYIRKIGVGNNDVIDFIKTKEVDHTIKHHLKFKASKVQELVLFIDGTYAIKENNKYQSSDSSELYYDKWNDIMSSAISHVLRKNPKLINYFSDLALEDSPVETLTAIDTYLANSDVLNRSGFNILDFEAYSVECVDDKMNAIILEHKVNNYARSIISKKYEHLITPETIEQFKTLYESGVSKNGLQEFVGRKLASIKDSDDFLKYIKKVVEHFSSFNREALFSKLDGLGIKPTYDKDGIVIFPVDTYNHSKNLGSISWCIVRNQHYYDDYTGNENIQYFLYDFNKKENDNYSMIGFTIKPNGIVKASHLKNDNSFTFADEFKDLYLEVLNNDIDRYKLKDEIKDLITSKFGNTLKKEQSMGIKI